MNRWAIRKILVATDFSEPAAAALEHAAALAATSGASLYAVHTFEFPVYGFYGAPFAVPIADYSDAMEKAARARLAALVAEQKAAGREVTGVLREGFASEQILAAARELGADLIVMGTHGRRGVPRLLIGSVAEKVLRQSPIPVLTVRLPEADVEASTKPAR